MQPSLVQFLLMTIAGWLSRKQQDAIEYLKEENLCGTLRYYYREAA